MQCTPDDLNLDPLNPTKSWLQSRASVIPVHSYSKMGNRDGKIRLKLMGWLDWKMQLQCNDSNETAHLRTRWTPKNHPLISMHVLLTCIYIHIYTHINTIHKHTQKHTSPLTRTNGRAYAKLLARNLAVRRHSAEINFLRTKPISVGTVDYVICRNLKATG